jgi:hypothetical protein
MTMRRTSTRPLTNRRIRLHLEALEGRLPVSEGIGTALAMAALSGVGAALVRGTAPPSARPPAVATGAGRTTPGETAVAGATAGSLLAVPGETAPAAPLTHGGPALDAAAGTAALGQQPFDDWTPGLLSPLGSAAGARRHHAGPDDGSDTAAGNLAGPLGGAPGTPADAVHAPAAPAGAVGTGAGTVAPPADLRGLTAAFFQAGGSAAATSTDQGTQEQGPTPPPVGTTNTLTYHGSPARTGWNSNETVLTPANVAANLGQVWSSPRLDSVTLGGTTYAPHIYASPLYVDSLHVTGGTYAGQTVGAVFTATSTGFVYAIKAFDTAGTTNIPAGTILWGKSLGQPTPTLDGGVTVGVLSTPTIDLSTNRLYVASDVTDGSGRNWDVFALDLGSGTILSGWPLPINGTTLAPINQNGPTTWEGTAAESQRGALNLSADGSTLYVPFGAYGDGGAGWMVSVNTRTPALASAFAGAPTNVAFANGGMWGSGGPAIDANGTVMDTTGNSPSGSNNSPHVWGNSFLEWNPATPLQLHGTYTPWNYSLMDQNDTDLGGGSPIAIDLNPASTGTPHLAAFGGKQGNAYLVDRANLKGSLSARQAPSTDSSTDTSLLPPGNQPQFGKPGPLNIFGPYSENSNQVDFAKSRSTPAYFQGPDGSNYVAYSGSTKAAVNSTTPVAPSLVLTKIVTTPGQPAYLAVAQKNTAAMTLQGGPVITSSGTANEILWVVDAGVMRTDSLTSPTAIHPTLYAYNALTLQPLWSSAHNELNVGGKYDSPTIARGTVFFGTDRIQAYGLTNDTVVDDSAQGTGLNQVHYVGSGWSHVNPTSIIGAFQGTVSNDATTNDYATIRFTGGQIKLYATERNNRGIAAVSVDGGAETLVDMYSASDAGDVLVYTSPVLASGTHTLKVRTTGTHDANSSGTNICIDRFNITPSASGVTTVDDAVVGTGQNQINYVGAWTHVTGTNIPNAFDGTVSYTDTANDSATIAFTGTQIKFYIAQRNNRGIAAVSVDGGPETNVDEYAAQDAGDVLAYTSPALAPGSHTFKVRNTGTHDANSSGTRVDIDRFDLLS